MDHVMDKDGNEIENYVYDAWNKYILSWILVRYGCECGDEVPCTIVLSDDHKKTNSEYESLYNVLKDAPETGTPEQMTEMKKKIEDVITDRTYSILVNFVNNSGLEDMKVEKKKYYRSILALTRGFRNDPIKAYVRWSYYREHNMYMKTLQRFVNIYWIYYFSDLYCGDFEFSEDTICKIDIEKALKYIEDTIDQPDSMLGCRERLCSVAAKKDIYYKKKITDLEKEIEELLVPDGAGYKVIKERFEKMQNNAELN